MSTSDSTCYSGPPVVANLGREGLEKVYIPLLSKAIGYLRVLPIASAHTWWLLGQGLSEVLRSQRCRVRVVLLSRGPLDEDAICQDLRSVDGLSYERRLALLGHALADGLLSIRVVTGDGSVASRGVISVDDGDYISFHSELDLSRMALLPGRVHETLMLFPSDSGSVVSYAAAIRDQCESDWDAKGPGRKWDELPAKVLDYILSKRDVARRDVLLDEFSALELEVRGSHAPSQVGPVIPGLIGGQPLSIRDYQRDALLSWKGASWRGILELATGAGKTVTAAYAATRIFATDKRLALIIGVPYQALADQWVEVLELFGFAPLRCYESRAKWVDDFASMVNAYNTNSVNLLCAVVVNRTLASDGFQGLLGKLEKTFALFVGDECHHYRSALWQDLLPLTNKRLGLSATPFSKDGGAADDRLESYFGPVAFRYPIETAIQDKVLSPYEYHVHTVDLTNDELLKYGDLAKRIADELGPSGDPEEATSPTLVKLLLERAQLFSTAANKLALLRKLLAGQAPTTHTLFYCAEGQADLGLDEEEGDLVLRHVEWVSVLLHELGWNVARFTAREGRQERKDILDRFKVGEVDALVAIRCLDEGIDIPACRTAFILASSRNPRQWVQRRGRVLRRAPGKDSAIIHDFFVSTPRALRGLYSTETLFHNRELSRIKSFATASQNQGNVLSQIKQLESM